ncbi:MAG: hypothetical protein L6R42_007589 [Xanthoria sp. 1 TBL-2021]|nr:MAG: hypothetical protein L6R42_007589 [Xanthoria sp. 1 TBL-2021]
MISIFCVISTAWNVIKNAAGLLAFLSGYSCVMGPVAGVMVSDFYLIKNRKLDVHELYKDHGIYHYTYGINWRAFAAFSAGFVPLIPGFAKSISPGLNVGGSWKYISPLGDALVDEAVLPSQTDDVTTEDDSYEAKDGLQAHTREVHVV